MTAEAILAEKGALIRALTLEDRSLAALRDLLLPKLVTGEIDVSHFDLDLVGESVT